MSRLDGFKSPTHAKHYPAETTTGDVIETIETAGTAMGFGIAAGRRNDGRVYPVSYVDLTYPYTFIGLTLAAISTAGAQVSVQWSGEVSSNAWSFTPNEPVFVGLDGVVSQWGDLTMQTGRYALQIGGAIDSNTIWISPNEPEEWIA